MTDIVERLQKHVPYYRTWAKDIRELNGNSVDADYSDETATDLEIAAAEIARLRSRVEELERRAEFMRGISPHVAAMLDEYDAPVSAVLARAAEGE